MYVNQFTHTFFEAYKRLCIIKIKIDHFQENEFQIWVLKANYIRWFFPESVEVLLIGTLESYINRDLHSLYLVLLKGRNPRFWFKTYAHQKLTLVVIWRCNKSERKRVTIWCCQSIVNGFQLFPFFIFYFWSLASWKG